MIKKIIILIVNIIVLCIIVFLADIIIYKYCVKLHKVNSSAAVYSIPEFQYNGSYSMLFDFDNYFNNADERYFSGRKPDGLEYTGKMPIVIFGCSVAFGQFLDSNQTFSHKLAHILKRPVYNRGIPGGGLSHLYAQSKLPSLYKTIPKTDTIIYVIIADHYRRSMVSYYDVLCCCPNLHYVVKNKKLIADDDNKIKNFLKSLYTIKLINHLYVNNFINNYKNSDKIIDNTLLYFTESRREFEKHWGKDLKFFIILYEDWDINYKDKLIKKLEDNGFNAVSTKDLTNANLRDEKYQMQDNLHPTAAAWDLLVPLIIEKFDLHKEKE